MAFRTKTINSNNHTSTLDQMEFLHQYFYLLFLPRCELAWLAYLLGAAERNVVYEIKFCKSEARQRSIIYCDTNLNDMITELKYSENENILQKPQELNSPLYNYGAPDLSTIALSS
jgi:hypothetical protein